MPQALSPKPYALCKQDQVAQGWFICSKPWTLTGTGRDSVMRLAQVLRYFLDLFMDEATPQERLTCAIKFIIIPMVQVCASFPFPSFTTPSARVAFHSINQSMKQ